MNFQELNSLKAKEFIEKNKDVPAEELLLKSKKNTDLNVPLLVAQIEGKRKAQKKLPSWYTSEDIIYPVKLSMEQCSSETTAEYKASLLNGKKILDLTGGFGVDCAVFSKKMEHVVYVEQNLELVEIAGHNFKILGHQNIEIVHGITESFITTTKDQFDWIYIDPARRKEGSKVFRFEDCEPDLLSIKKRLFELSPKILIKTSPLLDLDQAISELEDVTAIHVVSVENECKELVFILEKQKESEPEIVAVNIRKDHSQVEFRFKKSEEASTQISFQTPLIYLYEPNASILKAGAFRSLALQTGLFKLNASSHLYTSQALYTNFPGRSFEIIKTLRYSKKDILAEIPEGKANVTVRNFPDSVELIRKKTGLKDGGDHYLFATKDLNEKPIILLTKKIN